MPEGIVKEESTATSSYAKFIIQPLERGFGVTLGNAFRRVLLSSISGAAITAIKINGVLHEFTSIPGVLEDVTEVILNLKKIRLKLVNKKATKLDISINGPHDLKGEDLAKSCPDIEVLNPEQHIATLNSEAKLLMEVRFGMGKGYVPAAQQVFADQSIGLIPVDSIFTPLKKVNYEIKNVRIGESNDFEQLTIDILTDGTITPEEALSNAAAVLKEHINLFVNFDKEPEEEKVETEKDLESERLRKILTTSVDDLELSVRSHNCLKAQNIKTLGDLVRKDESEMLKFRNFGRKSLAELKEIVDNYNLEFGMDVDKYVKNNTDK